MLAVRSIYEIESLCLRHIFQSKRRYLKKNKSALPLPRVGAYFSPDVFSLNLSSNSMYSE